MKYRILLVLSICSSARSLYTAHERLSKHDQASVDLLLKFTVDVIRTTDERMGTMEYLKYNSRRSAAYEIGYLSQIIQEFYRKQVDKYHTCNYMRKRLYMNELVIYLEEIEYHYWDVEHVANMLHEIERKYGVIGGLDTNYEDLNQDAVFKDPNRHTAKRKSRKTKDPNAGKWDFAGFFKRKRTSAYTPTKRQEVFPLDYGWDVPPTSDVQVPLYTPNSKGFIIDFV